MQLSTTARPLPAHGALIALAFAPALLALSHPIPEHDPTQYAELGRRIAEGGQWGLLYDAFGPYLDKPPLTFWLIAVCIKLFGATSVAVRLPSLLAGAATVWTVRRIGRRLWDDATGTLAAALLASSVGFQLMIAEPKVDMVLTACTALCVLCLVEARLRPHWTWGAWAFGALAFLTKGPIGLAIPFLAVAPEGLRQGWAQGDEDRSFLRRLGRFQPILGPLLVAAVAAPWFIAQYPEWGWGSLRFQLVDQGIGRLARSAIWQNDAGPLFFGHTALWAFLPFTVPLILELARRGAAWVRHRRLPVDDRRVCLWWLVLPALALSASRYKLPHYLFPLVVPGALLGARQVPKRAMAWVGGGLGALALTAMAAWSHWCFPMSSSALACGTIASAAFIVGALRLASRWASPVAAGVPLIAGSIVFNVFFEARLHPDLLAFQPGEALGAIVRAAAPAGGPLPFVGVEATNAAAFYTARDVRNLDLGALEASIRSHAASLAVVNAATEQALRADGFAPRRLATLSSFQTSRPTWAFLNQRTRGEAIEHWIALDLRPR